MYLYIYKYNIIMAKLNIQDNNNMNNVFDINDNMYDMDTMNDIV